MFNIKIRRNTKLCSIFNTFLRVYKDHLPFLSSLKIHVAILISLQKKK